MVGSRELGIALIVVAPAGEDHHTASLVEGLDRGDLLVGVGGIRIAQRSTVTAGRSGEDEAGILLVAAGLDQFLAGVELNGTNRVLCSERAEVGHAVLIVAGNILVVVRRVYADVYQ